MNKVLEFSGCKLAIRVNTINAIDADPDDSKNIRLYIEGVYAPGGYNLHCTTEEAAAKIYSQIIEAMKDD